VKAIRRSALVVTGALTAILLLSGCQSNGATPTSGDVTPSGAGATVQLTADRALTAVQQGATVAVLQARLRALGISGTVATSGDRGVVVRVAPADVASVGRLAVPGRLELRQVLTVAQRTGGTRYG
jgi:hypothetical protein